jgi:hypothetical protein
MLHQLDILMCFRNKILLYVCIRMYFGVTLCSFGMSVVCILCGCCFVVALRVAICYNL